MAVRVKVSNTDYTHTEFESDEVGTVFENDTIEARAELVHLDWAGWDGAFGLQASRRDFIAIGDEAFVPASDSRDTGLFWIGERDLGQVKLELGARYDRNEGSTTTWSVAISTRASVRSLRRVASRVGRSKTSAASPAWPAWPKTSASRPNNSGTPLASITRK